jgi:amino acid transporter
MSTAQDAVAGSSLRRALRLRDLIFYGLIVIQPTAPMPMYGVVSQVARGHVVTTVLFAMVAMLLTAISYGRMARVYPSAGSAYSYVAGEFGAGAGTLVGWAILLDYLLNPLICVVWCSSAAANFLPMIPIWLWKLFFALLFTSLNLRAIQASARLNRWLTIALCAVVGVVLVDFCTYIFAHDSLTLGALMKPFYDPSSFSLRTVSTGTSIAALTYIGFDSISTLSEEAIDPYRDVMRATVLTCLLTGVLAAIEVYTAQLVWPDYSHYPNVDTAYVFVAGKAGGAMMFNLINTALLVATIGSGTAAMLGGARLLYGMGAQRALPRFFSFVSTSTNVPSRNVLLCGVFALVGAWTMSYQLGAELLNFGAFLAFIGVNASSFRHYWWKARDRSWSQALIPICGIAVCFYIWLSLRPQAKIAGFIWLAIGCSYFGVRMITRRRAQPGTSRG